MKSKSMDRFLYDRDLHHERIKGYKDKEAYLEPNQTFAKISRSVRYAYDYVQFYDCRVI